MSDELKQKAVLKPVAEEKRTLRGKIISGMPLSVAAKKRITKRFEEMTGSTVSFTSRVDKKQIAGIRVELNGYSYDETIHGQLLHLQKRLKAQSDDYLTSAHARCEEEEP